MIQNKLTNIWLGTNQAGTTRILVVDDDPKILSLLRTILTLAGYEVITASGGEQALRLHKKENPSLLLLDLSMPEMDGFAVLKRLRQTSQVPVIVISAHISHANEALQVGANAFLAKPFRPNDLVNRVKLIIEHRD